MATTWLPISQAEHQENLTSFNSKERACMEESAPFERDAQASKFTSVLISKVLYDRAVGTWKDWLSKQLK